MKNIKNVRFANYYSEEDAGALLEIAKTTVTDQDHTTLQKLSAAIREFIIARRDNQDFDPVVLPDRWDSPWAQNWNLFVAGSDDPEFLNLLNFSVGIVIIRDVVKHTGHSPSPLFEQISHRMEAGAFGQFPMGAPVTRESDGKELTAVLTEGWTVKIMAIEPSQEGEQYVLSPIDDFLPRPERQAP
jgi:hypothetical protein